MRLATHRRTGRTAQLLLAALIACVLLPAPLARAEVEYANADRIGIDEKLGETIPLDLTFTDEEGNPVVLGNLIERPTILLLVYLRCPSICSPLMNEVADTIQQVDVVAGADYDLVTVSFDYRETPDLALTGKTNLLARMDRPVPADTWHFLTGDKENIARLTDAVGFRFRMEKEDFVHAATVIFLSKEGKIVRYLSGLTLLPMDVKMAVLDAAEGKPRTLIQRIQKLCYAYDPEGKTYVFQVNRIVLVVTLLFTGIFLAWLLLRRRKPAPPPPVTPETTLQGAAR